LDRQGHSAFVWAVIGGIAQATTRLRLGTGVTCPTLRLHPAIIAQAGATGEASTGRRWGRGVTSPPLRLHPAIIAQAAATAAAMLPGRFFLGVGSGERLNEHILADHWPEANVGKDMLEEAVEVIRKLWKGKTTTHRGDYFDVENARVYTLPAQLPPIMIAAAGPEAAEL